MPNIAQARLALLRCIRGTIVDPFGYAHVRKTERALVAEFIEVVLEAVSQVNNDNHVLVSAIVALPEEIRGYEEVKLRNVATYRKRLAELSSTLPH
ncbi:DUF6537 domain-containing protein [Nocardia sp. NPDC051463]|uniref:DUF6537 domain-containing protein n=1 Tax=Nocardia sp. NPDC051463 TaxID=3154845 RepID=UPI003450257F